MLAERQTVRVQFEDLTPRETALLCAARAIAIGHAECALVRGLLAHQGQDPDGALAHLLAFVRLIGWRGARPVQLNLPGSATVSEDEVLMLEAVTAADEALDRGGSPHLDRAVEGLMGGCRDHCVAAAAIGLAEALAMPLRVRPMRLANGCA